MKLHSKTASSDSIAQAFVAQAKTISPAIMRLGTGSTAALSVDELEATILTDTEFLLRTLALANSAFYSQQNEIRCLRTALVVLGVDAIHNLAASLLARALHSSPSATDECLLRHSYAVGMVAQMLCETHRKAHPRTAFAAGLLHDTGVLALQTLGYEDDSQFADHDSLGGEIAEILGLSPVLGQAIRVHGDCESRDHDYTALEATIYIANEIAIQCGYSHDRESPGDANRLHDLVTKLELNASDLKVLTEALPERLEEIEVPPL